MTDPFKFRRIAFKGREFGGPYTCEAIRDLVGRETGKVLDVGCGNGAVLACLGATGTGIDLDEDALDEAKRRAPACRFIAGDAKSVLARLDTSPDLVICLGASQAIGSQHEALEFFAHLLRPGGRLLFGDGFWQKTPSPEYLEFLGADIDDMSDFETFRKAGDQFGLGSTASYVSNRDDWDSFEDSYYKSMLEWCEANPDDPDEAKFRQKMTSWRQAYETHGRESLGFAIVLYQKSC